MAAYGVLAAERLSAYMGFQNFFPIFIHFIMYLQWNKTVFDIIVFSADSVLSTEVSCIFDVKCAMTISRDKLEWSDNLTTFMCQILGIVGASASPNGLSRLALG